MNLTEGKVNKGGQNIPQPGELERRPPAPQGSGGKDLLASAYTPYHCQKCGGFMVHYRLKGLRCDRCD